MHATGQIRKGVVLAGRYRVVRRLGAGGMATVFLATDERLGREVAVKRLHTDAPEASLTRFQREAQLGAALNHPNLVAVYDTVAAEEGALIVMEYVSGSSLADVAAKGPVAPGRALPMLRSVAEALDHAHAQEVVHRDVKPANVLVRDDGVVKLADLGIARAVGATQITSEGSVIGTLPYMAPERMSGPGAGGPESDIFALAAVAYELLSGEPPPTATSAERAGDGVPTLREAWPAAPAAVAAALESGLDPDPRRRPRSAAKLIDELEAAFAADDETEPTRPLAAAAAPTVPRERSGGRGWPGGRRGAGIAALVLGLLAVAGIALAAGGGDGGEEVASSPATELDAIGTETQPEATTTEEASTPDGAALNDQGFALIEAKDYEAAIPVLERAVELLRGSGDELTYNYALFNLGHALREAGRPEEAIPILEERLAHPNQREEVARELEKALKDAGLESGEKGKHEGDKPGKGKGRDDDEGD